MLSYSISLRETVKTAPLRNKGVFYLQLLAVGRWPLTGHLLREVYSDDWK